MQMKKKIIAVFGILLFAVCVNCRNTDRKKDIRKIKSKPLPLFSVYLESRGMRKMKSKS